MNGDLRFDHTVLRGQVDRILDAWGLSEVARCVVIDAMTATDLAGVDSHGISMLPTYDAKRMAGVVEVAATPRVIADAAAYATIDGGGGLGHYAGATAMQLAIEKARDSGIAIVTVRNSRHFGAAGYYARMACDEGLIGIATTSTSRAPMIPTNGAEPVLGTNPIAFAAQGSRAEPFVLDLSTSTVAANKVRTYGYRDTPVPDGWVVDAAQRPVTDSNAAMSILDSGTGGGLTPLGGSETLGGHKGYGLAVMVQILCGALAGGDFGATRHESEPENIGHCMIAIDPEQLRGGDAFVREVDELLATLEATPPATNDRPVVVAGAPEAANRADRLVNGIPVPDALLAALAQVAERAGAEFVLDERHAVPHDRSKGTAER